MISSTQRRSILVLICLALVATPVLVSVWGQPPGQRFGQRRGGPGQDGPGFGGPGMGGPGFGGPGFGDPGFDLFRHDIANCPIAGMLP